MPLCASASILPQLASLAHRLTPPFLSPFFALHTRSATVVGPASGNKRLRSREWLRAGDSVSSDLFFTHIAAQMAA